MHFLLFLLSFCHSSHITTIPCYSLIFLDYQPCLTPFSSRHVTLNQLNRPPTQRIYYPMDDIGVSNSNTVHSVSIVAANTSCCDLIFPLRFPSLSISFQGGSLCPQLWDIIESWIKLKYRNLPSSAFTGSEIQLHLVNSGLKY